jgi:hypothetical protein
VFDGNIYPEIRILYVAITTLYSVKLVLLACVCPEERSTVGVWDERLEIQ